MWSNANVYSVAFMDGGVFNIIRNRRKWIVHFISIWLCCENPHMLDIMLTQTSLI